MTIASDLFRTVTVKINDISQQLPYIVVNQADDNGKIIRFVPMDHGQKVTGFTGARLYYPPRSDDQYGDYVTGVESDGAWDFTIPVGVLSVGRVGCNLSFIDGNGETYSRNVVFLVEPAVSGVFDPEDGQQTRIDKIIGTVQDTADTAIGSINKTASDAVDSIGKAEASINESVTVARGSADAAANSEQQASASASAAQTSERNASNSAMQASQSATAAKQSETNAAESERNAASSAEQAANIVASVSGSVSQAENAARSASQSATAAAGSASAAGGNAQAAAQSASDASASASAAKASETNAASSASAAKTSETNAADSATAAQQAVDGFGLTVGSVTTGEPGTDAAVDITKTGAKYTANFTIPRGEKGEQGGGGTENVLIGTASGTKGSMTDFGSGFIFYMRCDGLQQGVEYHDTVQIVLASGTDIPSDFPKNESSEVALPSDLNLADGDTLVIDSDGSTQITHSSGEPTPSTPVTLPAIPAPTFAIYTKGGLTRPTVDVDYERNINIVINKLEQAIAVQAATMKVNQLTD